MDAADCLRRVPLLKGLDPESIALLATHTRSVSFPANAMIVERGEVGVPLFVVLEGRAGVTDPAPFPELDEATLESGDSFGAMSLLDDEPHSTAIQALDDVRLLVLDRADFRDVLAASPATALQILESLSIQIRGAHAHISSLSEKAMRDPLTGILNRRAYEERIKEEVGRTLRYDDHFALILIDVDQFKSINDEFGHDVGDTVLIWMGRLLTEHTRSADTPFRIGGDEFAILAPATRGEVAHHVTQRIVNVLAEARPRVDFEVKVTASAGYACCPDHGASVDALFTQADSALYRAKQSGRNRICGPDEH